MKYTKLYLYSEVVKISNSKVYIASRLGKLNGHIEVDICVYVKCDVLPVAYIVILY